MQKVRKIMGKEITKLINRALSWDGYLEKKSNRDLDDFTANAGNKNYTCFARDYREHTGQNLQGQPWCAMYVSEVFIQAFGLEAARRLLGGNLYHYCPTGVAQFKKAGRWSQTPEPGAVIFFTNGQRSHHTGIVTEVTSSRVKTIEGNTSGASGVIPNGGGVCRKSYRKDYGQILGYGIPDWSIVAEPEKKSGWIPDAGAWRYYHGDTGEPVRNDWHRDPDGRWYWFDGSGAMVTNAWRQDKAGKWYYLGSDGAMVTGRLMQIGDEVFAFSSNGAMLQGEIRCRTDARGALTIV